MKCRNLFQIHLFFGHKIEFEGKLEGKFLEYALFSFDVKYRGPNPKGLGLGEPLAYSSPLGLSDCFTMLCIGKRNILIP